MPIARFEMPDGRIARFEVPEGTTPEQAQQMMQSHFDQPSQIKQQESTVMQDVAQGAGNVLAGAVRGAGSIGATLIRPFETAEENTYRRQQIDEGLRTLGAEPESLLYQGGKIAGEVAGTAGIGGGIAKGVKFAPRFASALQAGGFARGAGLGTNIAAGALTGGSSAGLTGGDVGTGALIGGALPAGVSAIKTTVPAVLGMTTGAGGESIKQAFLAGKKGGETAKTFAENLRGNVPITQVLDDVNANLAAMGKQKADAYRQGMAQVSGDKTVLSFDGIDKAMKTAYDMATYKGVIKNVGAAKKLQEAYDAIGKWKQLNPAEYHTPEGMDALKQNIGGILESIPFEERTARNAVGDIYSAVKKEINKQAPVYSKVMKDYSDASELIGEVRKTLSNKPNASVDTQMRKLQSLMRNNVNTSYGNRLDLVREMESQGGREIIPAIAGQSLSTLTPRGIQGATTIPTSLIGYSAGGIPLAGAGLLAGSPRLVGEAAYGTGRLADLASRIPYSKNALEAARLSAIIEGSR